MPPPKNSTTSDFDEIWAINVNLQEKNNEIGQNSLDYINFPKISNGSNQNNVGGHVRELWGVVAPKLPHFKIQIFLILVKFGPYM